MRPERGVPPRVCSAWKPHPNANTRNSRRRCERLAKEARTDHHRAVLREMADAWRKLRRDGAASRTASSCPVSRGVLPSPFSRASARRNQTCAIWISTTRVCSLSLVRAISRHSCAKRRYWSDLSTQAAPPNPGQRHATPKTPGGFRFARIRLARRRAANFRERNQRASSHAQTAAATTQALITTMAATRLTGRCWAAAASVAVLGHDLGRDQADHERDAQGHQDHVIQIAHDRNEVGNEIDRRERIAGNQGGQGLRIPGHAGIAPREVERVDVALDQARPVSQPAFRDRHGGCDLRHEPRPDANSARDRTNNLSGPLVSPGASAAAFARSKALSLNGRAHVALAAGRHARGGFALRA